MGENFTPTQFRVFMIVNPPSEPIYVEVKTMGEALKVIDTMVAIRENLIDWEADVSDLEYVDESNEWTNWYDHEGNDFDHYYDNRNKIEQSILQANLATITEGCYETSRSD